MLLPIPLILFSLLILLAISLVVWSLILLVCHWFFPALKLRPVPVVVLPKEELMALENEMSSFTICPKILGEATEEQPPDYFDLEEFRASPLPTYEEIIYHDGVRRSVEGLLSP